jgi:LmbE family N-acetylglucosaminyl deacetylase
VRLELKVTVLLVATLMVALAQESSTQQARFTFPDSGRSITLTASDGAATFEWPAGGEWTTALLGVQVQADPGAALPYVEISAGGASDRQYVAPGRAGEEWVNLSFLRGAVTPGSRVSLRGTGAAVAASSGTLRLFTAAPELSKSVLVLAPHPDDAEIAAFGVYATTKSTVVTVTAGNAGAPNYESVFEDPVDLYLFKGRIRLIDSITVPWQGGVPPERAFNLGYFDARLAEMYDKRDAVVPEMYRPNSDINVYRRDNIGSLLPKRPLESRWDNLVDDVLAVLKKVKPAAIVAPHPQLDTHRDHQFTTVALSEALRRWNDRVTLLLYTNHADENRYPYGTAGTLMSLPPPPGNPAEIQLDRMYSHPVSSDLQRRKLFALESMHDLRYNPNRQYQLAKGDDRAATPEKPGPDPDITYLRRGPRSNELFYAYDRDTFRAMIDAFLATRKPRS